MDIVLPHSLTYNIIQRPDAEEVAATIISNKIAIVEAVSILEKLVPGLEVSKCKVEIESITQNSPLREAFMVAILATYQSQIGKDVPKIIDGITGVVVPDEYATVISLLAVAIVFYGVSAAIDIIKSGVTGSLAKKKYNELVSAVSEKTGVPEDEIRRVFDNVIRGKKKQSVIKSSLNFFRPVKREPKSSILIPGSEPITPEIIAEVPDSALLENIQPEEHIEPIDNVEIHLIAQDKQHKRQGWAGILPSVGENRLRMAIMPPIRPQDVFLKSTVRADITLISRMQDDGSYKPYMFHLNRLRD